MDDILKKLLEKYSELQAYGDKQGNKIDRQIMGDKYVDNNEGPSPTGLASDMAGSTAGITRAEQELGRYAGKAANTMAGSVENFGNNDMLAHARDMYTKLKDAMKKRPDLAEDLQPQIDNILSAKKQFKNTGMVDEAGTPMDELWTESYGKGPESYLSKTEEISPEYKNYMDKPKGSSYLNTPEEAARLDKSLENAGKFYNPTDDASKAALNRFKTKQTSDPVGTMREFAELKKAIQEQGYGRQLTDAELLKSYPKDPSEEAIAAAKRIIDEKLRKKATGQFDPDSTN